jgi:hypothetical protein
MISAAAIDAPGCPKEKAAAKDGGMKSRVCVICNKMFLPKAEVQKTCSEECRNEKDRRYALARYYVRIGKPQPAPKAKKTEPAATVQIQQQSRSFPAPNASKPNARKPPVVANKAPVEGTAPVTRVDRIRAAVARLDGMPQSAIDAAHEAAKSEAL